MSTPAPRVPRLGLVLAGALLALLPWTEAGGATPTSLWLDAALHLVAWTLIVTEMLRGGAAGVPRALLFLLPAAAAAVFSATRAFHIHGHT